MVKDRKRKSDTSGVTSQTSGAGDDGKVRKTRNSVTQSARATGAGDGGAGPTTGGASGRPRKGARTRGAGDGETETTQVADGEGGAGALECDEGAGGDTKFTLDRFKLTPEQPPPPPRNASPTEPTTEQPTKRPRKSVRKVPKTTPNSEPSQPMRKNAPKVRKTTAQKCDTSKPEQKHAHKDAPKTHKEITQKSAVKADIEKPVKSQQVNALNSVSAPKSPKTGMTEKTTVQTDTDSEKVLNFVSQRAPKTIPGEDDLFAQILKNKQTIRLNVDGIARAVQPYNTQSISVVHYLNQHILGFRCPAPLKKSTCAPISDLVSDLQLYRVSSPFDRRCTALEWHPDNPDKLVVGSKGGDIILWDIKTTNQDVFIHGKGPGGSIQAIKFDPRDATRVITASINGTVTSHDLTGVQTRTLADTENFHDFWFCSLDVSDEKNIVMAGDNTGNGWMMSHDGKQIWKRRLHKNKITHVEFSPRDCHVMCTGSLDHVVKIWDVRMLSDKNSFLCALQHDKGINSAYYSHDGCRLLTTDQHHELRVYSAPSYTLHTQIIHPHRFFQHLTPFKAEWHPLVDLIVCGRYPDEKLAGQEPGDARTVDIIDADSGAEVTRLRDPGVKGLVSLNKFHPRGDMLASTMGVNILLWARREFVAEKQEELMAAMKGSGLTPRSSRGEGHTPGGSRGQGHSRGQSQGQRGQSKKKKPTETKTKTKTQTKTKERKR